MGVDIESASRLTSLALAREILGLEERAQFGSDEQLNSVLSLGRELLVSTSPLKSARLDAQRGLLMIAKTRRSARMRKLDAAARLTWRLGPR